jgi:uncharacterized protein
LALSLAGEEELQSSALSLELVELAALLHDVKDWKYSGSETAGVEAARAFLAEHKYPADRTNVVAHIIEMVGFKSELARREVAAAGSAAGSAAPEDAAELSPAATAAALGVDLPLLFGLVQDADRLDAIGAVGIARCFTFGGHKKRPMYDPEIPIESDNVSVSAAHYKTAEHRREPSINHFYVKLLKLRDLMKTSAGRARAEQRHQFMLKFLEQFHLEVEGKA